MPPRGPGSNPRRLPEVRIITGLLRERLTPERREKVVECMIANAEAGEPWAIELILDRLEGKAPQQVFNAAGTLFDHLREELEAEEPSDPGPIPEARGATS